MNRKYSPFVCFTAIQIAFHLLMTEIPILDGFRYFAQVLDEYSLTGFLSMRYHTWSSRIVIEGFEAVLSRHFTLWRVCDILVWVLLYVSLTKLIGTFPSGKAAAEDEAERKKTGMNWLIAAGLLCYPIIDMSSAGWIATMMNYAWPLAFGLYALTIPTKLLHRDPVRIYEYVLGSLAMVYACNAEQAAAVLFGVLLLLGCGLLITERRFSFVFPLYLAIDIAELALVFLCPGNAARSNAEIAEGIRDFKVLSKADKLYLGFSDMMEKLLGYDRLLLFVTVLLFVVVLMKFKRLSYGTVALVPLLMTIRAGTFGSFFQNYLFVLDTDELLGAESYMLSKGYLAVVFRVVFLVCFALVIAILSDSRAEWLFLLGVFLLGLSSRVVMGFSPSLYASGARTMIYLHISLLFIALYFVWKERELFEQHPRVRFGTLLFASALGVFGTMNSLGVISVWV